MMTSGVLLGAGATALTGTLLFASPLGATEGNHHKVQASAKLDTATVLADAAQRTITAGDAGLVTVERTGTLLKVVSVTPSAGWIPEVKRAVGETVKVGFTSADGAKIHVRGHLTDEGLFRYSVKEKGTFDRARFEKTEAEKAAFFQAVAAKAEAEKAAAAKAAADKAAAEQAAAVKAQQKAAAAQAEAGEKKDDDGRCGDKDGDGKQDFDGARADHDWDDQDWDDHDGDHDDMAASGHHRKS